MGFPCKCHHLPLILEPPPELSQEIHSVSATSHHSHLPSAWLELRVLVARMSGTLSVSFPVTISHQSCGRKNLDRSENARRFYT